MGKRDGGLEGHNRPGFVWPRTVCSRWPIVVVRVIVAFLDNFIITNEPNDYVESNDIQKWIDEEKLGITMKKLGVDFKAYVGVNKFDKIEIRFVIIIF
jgi:hypothetical protein